MRFPAATKPLCSAVVAAAVLIIDQATKTAAELAVVPWAVPIRNNRAALSVPLASGFALVLMAIAATMLFAAHLRGRARRGEVPGWAPACFVGGAISNLLDRLLLGAVRDFIPTPWIVFNLADVALVVVAGMMFAPEAVRRLYPPVTAANNF